MNKITLTGFIEVPQNELEAIKSALVNHIELTRLEKGCMVFSVTQRKDNPLIFDVYEEFTSKESFENHQNRVANSEWGSITKNVKRHYEIAGG